MELRPAEVFNPGEYIQDELEARGWLQADLAEITGVDPGNLNGVIKGKRSVSVLLAIALGKAFDTSADMWINLQSQYDLWKAQEAEAGEADEIGRKARLFAFPVREMIKRHWIEDTESIDVLEHQMKSFCESESIEASLSIAARRSKSEEPPTLHQIAWLYRSRQLARVMDAPDFSKAKLNSALKELEALRISPEATREVPRILSSSGVRFVVIEGLSGLKADGVCFWLDNKKPVIAMSLRIDRIDNFWFTLRHEIEHVRRGDGKGVSLADARIDSTDSTAIVEAEREAERSADDAAAAFCVDPEDVEDCMARIAPYFSGAKVRGYARLIAVHPGLLVGQLHRREDGLPYTHLRKLLVGVRKYVLETAYADGWDIVPQF